MGTRYPATNVPPWTVAACLWRMLLEAAQNLPLIASFVLARGFWGGGTWAAAILAIVAGSVAAAAVIWLTEPAIFAGHREEMRAVLANIVTFSLLMMVGTLYLSASWSAWWTDLLVGLGLAIALALGQELAAGERFGLLRSLALGLSCAVSLLLVRLLVDGSALVAIAAITIWFTVVMGLYKEARILTGWVPATVREEAGEP